MRTLLIALGICSSFALPALALEPPPIPIDPSWVNRVGDKVWMESNYGKLKAALVVFRKARLPQTARLLERYLQGHGRPTSVPLIFAREEPVVWDAVEDIQGKLADIIFQKVMVSQDWVPGRTYPLEFTVGTQTPAKFLANGKPNDFYFSIRGCLVHSKIKFGVGGWRYDKKSSTSTLTITPVSWQVWITDTYAFQASDDFPPVLFGQHLVELEQAGYTKPFKIISPAFSAFMRPSFRTQFVIKTVVPRPGDVGDR